MDRIAKEKIVSDLTKKFDESISQLKIYNFKLKDNI